MLHAHIGMSLATMPQRYSTAKGVAPRHASGMTLIEVLVAVVVLGLGVMSIVELQLVSKRSAADAGAQSLAASYSWEIIERMRMNAKSTALTDYVVRASQGIGGGQQGSEPSPVCDSTHSCTEIQLADHDVWSFEQQLDGSLVTAGGSSVGGLVNPTACITGSSVGAAGIYTITVVWRSKTPLPVPTGYDNTFCGYQRQSGGNYLYGSVADCQKATNSGIGTADCFRRAYTQQAYIAP